MKRFRSAGQVQRFLSIHDPIANLVHLRRHQLAAADYRTARGAAFGTWAQDLSVALSGEPRGSGLRPLP
jgi:putative transposase